MSEVIVPIAVVLLGGGLLIGLASYIKARPEANQIIVTSAQGAVIVQSGVLDDLHEELARQTERYKLEREELQETMRQDRARYERVMGDLEERLLDALERIKGCEKIMARLSELETEIAELKRELEATRIERNELAAEKAALEKRVKDLEQEVRRLKQIPGNEDTRS